MLMKILDVLLSAVPVGAFIFVVYVTFDTLCDLKEAAANWVARKLIDLRQKARKRRHENPESRH